MAEAIREATVIELAASRARLRASDYRSRAIQLRAMAEVETIPRLRDDLLRMADQYEGLATRLQ